MTCDEFLAELIVDAGQLLQFDHSGVVGLDGPEARPIDGAARITHELPKLRGRGRT